MAFVLSKVLWELLRPSTLLVLCALFGAGLLWWGRLAWGRYLLTRTLLAMLLPALLPVGDLLTLPLENRFPPPELPPRVDGILVLGGAELPNISAARAQPSFNGAAERVMAAAVLANRYPEAWVVFTGGSSALLREGRPSAGVAGRFFADLGLPRERTMLEPHARNTFENALFTARLVAPKPGERWLLVTSAAHMPRSVGLYRKVGWDLIPYPVDYRTSGRLRLDPSLRVIEALHDLDEVTREWAGLVAYRLMGRTDRLLPAP